MSDHHEHGALPEGEEPRWLDKPENLRKLIRGFFAVCAVTFLADLIFLFVHKHNSFESQVSEPGGFQKVESWFGFYSLYGLAAIVLLVALSVVLRKVVMRPEDYYSRDYPENAGDAGNGDGGAHHG